MSLFICPICQSPLTRDGSCYRCESRHSYDISREGYVHLLPANKKHSANPGDDKDMIAARTQFLDGGWYAPLREALSRLAVEHTGSAPAILDAGCGEGYYTKAVCPGRQMTRIGFDLSKDAVRLAARGEKTAMFFAADLKRIPLSDGCADAVLDIFTPADYSEFKRVLKPQGVLIKLAPRSGYLKELREAAGGLLRHKEYDDGDVARYAEEKMEILHREAITYTMDVTPETMRHLARMTPMLAGVDLEKIDLTGMTRITIDENMYIGYIK